MGTDSQAATKTRQPLAAADASAGQDFDVIVMGGAMFALIWGLAGESEIADEYRVYLGLAAMMTVMVLREYQLARRKSMIRRDAFLLAILGPLLYRLVRWISLRRAARSGTEREA